MLEAGNLVPADGRLIEGANLRIQEAALTGESESVAKDPSVLYEQNLPLGDRRNMLYSGTVVTQGRGEVVVTETGMDTELGAIAAMLGEVEGEKTPLQRRLDQVGKTLVFAALAIVGLVFVLGLLRGEDLQLLFPTAVSLSVAAVPEGLPAVVTIALALGAQRMLRRRALIRKLPAVETLGSMTVICTDKTGTLTENRMTVVVLDVAGHRTDLTAEQPFEAGDFPELTLLLTGGALSNDALLETDTDERDVPRALGDPTEGALVVAAAREGLRKPELEEKLPRVAELPFDSDHKRMTTVHEFSEPGSSEIPEALKTVLGRSLEKTTAPW